MFARHLTSFWSHLEASGSHPVKNPQIVVFTEKSQIPQTALSCRVLEGGGAGGEGGGLKNRRRSEVLRMKFPIVENARTSSDIVLVISRGLQLPYRNKFNKSSFCERFFELPYFFRIFFVSTLVDGPCSDPCLWRPSLASFLWTLELRRLLLPSNPS